MLNDMASINETENRFLQRLKEEREKTGMSQLELAYRAGLSQNMITYLETGKRTPNLTAILKICNALEINHSVLLEDDDEQREEMKNQIYSLVKKL